MAEEAKPTTTDNSAPAAPAAAAPQAPLTESPPAAAPAAAPSDVAASAAPEPTLLEQFDATAKAADAKPDTQGESDNKPAETAGDKPKEGAADAKPDGKADEKAADAKPADGKSEKPVEAKPEPAKLDPVEYAYELPETIKLDDARKTEFHTALDGFRADPAKGAQGLIALHEKAMTEYAQSVLDNQIKTWNDTRKQWRTEVMADEQIGGAGYETAMGQIARMRDLFVPEAERKSFDDFMKVTGAGDHPAFLKMLHRAGRYFDEGRMPPRDIRPAPDNGRQPGRRGALLYDHPRSPQNRQ